MIGNPFLLMFRGWLVLLTSAVSCAALAGEPTGPLSAFAAKRTFSDQSGRFKIEAELQHADQDNVRLLKSDGRSVTVPLAQLSSADQAFIEGFLKAESALKGADAAAADEADNPFSGGEPGGTATGSTSIPERRAIVAGFRPINITPNEEFWSAPPIRPFPDVSFDEIVIQTALPKPFFAGMRVLAGGRTGTVVLNSYRQSRKEDENYGKFVVANAVSGENSDVLEYSEPWKMLAISADGSRMAAVRVEGFDKGNDLAIFQIKENQLVPEFQFTAGGGSWDELHWAAFLPNNRLATISQKHHLTFWDLGNKVGVKTLRRGPSGGALSAEITKAGELMALVVGSSIAVVETEQGRLVGCIIRDEPVNQIAFSPDGSRLAAFHPFSVTLYSTEDGQEVRRIAVSEGNAKSGLHWVGKYLMVGSVLYDTERGMPLWTYEGGATGRAALGSYLFSAFGRDKESIANVIRIPHEEAIRSAEQVDPETIFAIVPGDSVSVQFELGSAPANVQSEIRAAVESKLSELGWQLASSSSNVIQIGLEQGEEEESEYYERRGVGPFFAPPGFGPRPSGPSIKVKFRPWTHTASIAVGGKEVFKTSYTRTSPNNLRRKDGESTQQAVLRHCQPSPDYFSNLAVPPHLLKQEYQGGLGKSKIEPNGLR